MCGIFGVTGDKPVVPLILDGLLRLSYRGYDSWGITVPYQLESTTMAKVVPATYKQLGIIDKDAKTAVAKYDSRMLTGCTGIGHTRWATHGGVSIANTHPFIGCRQNIAIVHNGIIDNWTELKERLSQNGHFFHSNTDSEVIVHLLEEYKKGSLSNRLQSVINILEGSYAIAACNLGELAIARKNQPLVLGKVDNCYLVSSDAAAFSNLTTRYFDIQEEVAINPTQMDLVSKQYTLMAIPEASQKTGSNQHFMLNEIREQPAALLRAIDQNEKEINSLALDILSYNQVVLTGCGTSRNAALIGRYAFSAMRKKWSTVIVGSELPLLSASANNSFLVLAVSQSGETADITHHASTLLKQGVCLASIVNVPHSQLDKMSHKRLYMKAGTEYGVAATKSFLASIAILYLITGSMVDGYTEMKKQISEINLQEILDQEKQIGELAKRISEHNDVYFIARDSNYPIACEAALKLKEVSYIHAEGMSAGELKHGTLSLVNKGTPVIGICPDDYTRLPMINNLQEVKARGGWIIGISNKESDVFDEWIKIPTVPDLLYPLVSIVPAQLIAYYAAVARNLNPDFPRSLAKSVTVQ